MLLSPQFKGGIKIFYLSDLQPGEVAYIHSVGESALKNRLYDLGMVGGTRVECIAVAPFGGPAAYLVRGAVIALRREDAGNVEIIPIISESYAPIKIQKHAKPVKNHISGGL